MGSRKPIELKRWRPGAMFAGKYEVLAVLGGGAEACAYVGRQDELHEVLVLHLSRAHHGGGSRVEDLERLRRIEHENVERISAVGQHEVVLFVVAEHVAGHSLEDLLSKSGPLALPQVFRDTGGPDPANPRDCDALPHEVAGVIHRCPETDPARRFRNGRTVGGCSSPGTRHPCRFGAGAARAQPIWDSQAAAKSSGASPAHSAA